MSRGRVAWLVVGWLLGSLLWLAVGVVGRARWFDLRCFDLAETSVRAEWIAWFPPHLACLDGAGQVVARDHTETLWLLVLWGPVVAAGVLLAAGVRRARRRAAATAAPR